MKYRSALLSDYSANRFNWLSVIRWFHVLQGAQRHPHPPSLELPREPSASRPIWVGKSTARFSPVSPFLKRYLISAFAVRWGTGLIINLWPVQAGRYAVAGYGAGFGVCFVLVLALYVLLLLSRRAATSRD